MIIRVLTVKWIARLPDHADIPEHRQTMYFARGVKKTVICVEIKGKRKEYYVLSNINEDLLHGVCV